MQIRGSGRKRGWIHREFGHVLPRLHGTACGILHQCDQHSCWHQRSGSGTIIHHRMRSTIP